MPISGSDFEESGRESSVLLIEFLRSNSRNAYNVDELGEMLASMGSNLTREEVERILVSLEYAGRVKSKIIAGVTYYRYCKVLGYRPARRFR